MTSIEITPVEVLALKELSLVVGGLRHSIKDQRANMALTAMLRVLVDVTARADIANRTAGRK